MIVICRNCVNDDVIYSYLFKPNKGFLTQVTARDKPGLDPRLGQVSETEIRVSETEIRVSPLAPHVARPFYGLGRLSAATRRGALAVGPAARSNSHG